MRRLSELNIRCTYALVNSIAAVIDRVGAVILSCECVFANGDALVPTGGAMIALTAKHHNIPIIILAPTHKFADKVQHVRFRLIRRMDSRICRLGLTQTTLRNMRC